MKRFDFSKKHNICFVCFCIIMLFASILCFSFPVVHAEGEAAEGQVTTGDHIPVPIPSGYVSLKSRLSGFDYNFFSNVTCFGEDAVPPELSGYTDVFYEHDSDNIFLNPDLYDEDLYNGEVLIDANSIERNYEGYTYEYDEKNNHFTSTHVSDLSVEGFQQYALTYSNATLQLWLFDKCGEVDSYKNNIAPVNSCGFYYNDGDAKDSINYKYPFIKLNSVTQTVSGVPGIYVLKTTDYDVMNYGQTFKVGEGTASYDKIAFYGNSGVFINSNIPLYWTDFSQRNLDGNSYQTNQVPSGNGGANVVLQSEIFGDPHYSITIENSGSLDNIYPDGSGGDVTNNMALETADWKFNIPKYWGNVTSTLVQPKYTGNWGSGTVMFTGLCNDFIQNNASDYKLKMSFYVKVSGHRFSDTHSEINENFNKSFAYRDVEVPLSDVLTEKSINYNISVKDIFTYAVANDGITNVNSFIEPIKSYNSIDNWDWTLSCDCNLISGNYTSGSIQEKYNFISQVSKEVANSISENNNPYVPEDENGNPQLPDSDSSSSSSSNNGKGGIYIYNNPTFNNDVNANSNATANGGGMGSGIVPALLGSLANNQQSSVDTIESISGINGWMTVVNDTFTFVPEGIITAITVAFIACVGIMVIAFVISLVIKLIT